MAIKSLLASCLLLCGCLHAQYKVVVVGSGNKQAFIAENPTVGSNGSCYDIRTTDPTTHLLHDAGQMCGLFFATGYAGAGITIQTVTGDSVFQTNTTFRDQGMIVGDTNPPSWFTPPDVYADVVSASNIATAVLDGSSGTDLIFRNGGLSTGNKVWDIATGTVFGNSALFFRLFNDSHASQFTWLQVVRNANVVSSVTLPELVTTEGIAFDADNLFNVGTNSSEAANMYSTTLQLGRTSSRSGILFITNAGSSGPFQFVGSNTATGGADVAIGNAGLSASSLYPSSSNVDLGYASGRFRKIWVNNIDISGTCTGCGAGANTALSNLTNPTAINQDLFTIGTNVHVQDGSGHDLVELQNNATYGSILTTTSGGSVLVNINNFGVDVATGLSFNVGGLAGETHTVTTGTCTMNFTGGVLTSTSGC